MALHRPGAVTLLAVIAAPALALASGDWFEQAPAMLPSYLDRLPAKSLGALYLETTPPRPETPPPTDDDLAKLVDQLPKASRAALIKRVDELLAAARDNYQNGDWCNLLNDVRDVLASPATNADAAAYIQWRLDHEEWFGFGPTPPGQEPPDPNLAVSSGAVELEKRAAAAPPALKPQWLYLRGALGFCQGDRADCPKWFEQVWKNYPEHPRAEAALFLSARCALSQSRSNDAPDTPAEEAREQKARDLARSLFKSYLEKYPSGRFAADAEGWMGALDYMEHHEADALADYIRELETPGHPEVAKSALFMCEKVLAHAGADDDALFALAARHPLVAMGATYYALNREEGPDSPDSQNQEESVESDFARAKKWRQAVLPKLAARVAAQQAQYRSDGWPPKYLALLAQAASDSGDQAQALTLTDSLQLDRSDDLLLARGAAFQRAGKPADAIGAFRALLEHFPKSQLARGTQLKLAVALLDNHQAGLALLELEKLRAGAPPAPADDLEDTVYPPADRDLPFTASAAVDDISGAEAAEIDQLADALENFAPLPELEAALAAPEAGEDFRKRLEPVLAQRLLAEEDFAAAGKFLAGNAPARPMAARLEILTEKVGATRTPDTKAHAMLELGDAWAGVRGSLLRAPLDLWETESTLFASQDDQAALRRRANGLALGFKNTDHALEERDELRHAARWWMRAARALPGSALAATARWKALQAIPEIAQASDYAYLRAVETGAAKASRELYDRLRQECPGSVEARKYAAYWSFPMHPPKPGEFLAFDEHTERERNALGRMGCTDFPDGAFSGIEESLEVMDWDADQNAAALNGEILALRQHATDWDTPRLAAEVESLRSRVRDAHPGLEASSYLNLLDDLALFLQEPALSAETRAAYFELRLRYDGFIDPLPDDYGEPDQKAADEHARQIAQAMAAPALKPVPDYVDFIKAAQGKLAPARPAPPSTDVMDDVTFYAVRTQQNRDLEASMREFLTRYPKSRKREAARLLLARAVHWLTTPLVRLWNEKDDVDDLLKKTEMQTPMVTKVFWPEKFDARRAFEPLDAYDREFPNGRYAADIRAYRGAAALQARQWGLALDATMTAMDDGSHPELKTEAALRLATVFAALAKAEDRAPLLEAIRQRPKAVERLQQYLAKTWRYKDHPLRCLGDYLADQLGFHLAEPAETPEAAASSQPGVPLALLPD